jgi:hypothetical protein
MTLPLNAFGGRDLSTATAQPRRLNLAILAKRMSEGLMLARIAHDPEKWKTGFPKKIMLNQ